MSDDSIKSRQKISNENVPENPEYKEKASFQAFSQPDAPFTVLPGKMPTSLLKQALASPKIQKTFQDFKDRNDLPFAEESPSMEMILEHELIAAYDEVLEKIEEEKTSETNLMLKNAIEIETVCQDFIEEVLAEHLETQFDKHGNKWPELLERSANAKKENGHVAHDLIEPPVASLEKEAPLGSSISPNSMINQRARSLGRTSLLAGMLIGPALAVAIFAKVQSPEKFDGFVDLTLAKTGQFLVAMIPDEGADASKDTISAGAIQTDAKNPENSTTIAASVLKPVRNVSDEQPAAVDSANKVAIASIDTPASLQTLPVVREVQEPESEAVTLDETSIIKSKIKTYQRELTRLETLLSNPNQPKREEIETLITDKKATIDKLEDSLGLVAESPSPQSDGVQPANFIVSDSAPEPQSNVLAYEGEPRSTSIVDQENIEQASLSSEQPAGQQKTLLPREYYQGKFVNIISIRQLPEQQRFALAEQLAKGECLVPAVKSALNHVPTLVMRDLVLTLPEHC